MNKRGFNTVEAAYYIGMSEEYLRKARVTGPSSNGAPAPRFIKLGRCVRYLQDDLDAFLDNQIKCLTLAEAHKGKEAK